jgi:predicted phage terminase large subunit-like protein
MGLKIDADLVRSFTKLFLWSGYDDPKPVPDFHNEMWRLCCSDSKNVAIAAPRGFAKSSAITLAYVLCAMLFRERQFCVLISNTYEQAILFLADIRSQLEKNEDLIEYFEVAKVEKATENDIIVRMKDGHLFRIRAYGSEQEIRGAKWNNKRPDLVVMDDGENAEIVNSKERRKKFRDNILKNLLPLGSGRCVFRIVGTVLHADSFLYRILNDKNWASLTYKACKAFDDFTELLWPEKMGEKELREVRDMFVSQDNASGFCSEYLNEPVAEEDAMFREGDFRPIAEPGERLTYYASADFAISKAERADKSAFKVAGMNSKGTLKYVYSYKARLDANEIMDELFRIQRLYDPELFFLEAEKIQKVIGPILYDRMGTPDENGVMRPFINCEPITPSKDKRTRARPLQARMRSGSVEWATEEPWYEEVKHELLSFTGLGDQKDDDVDSAGLICLGLKKIIAAPSEEEINEAEYQDQYRNSGMQEQGISIICGY